MGSWVGAAFEGWGYEGGYSTMGSWGAAEGSVGGSWAGATAGCCGCAAINSDAHAASKMRQSSCIHSARALPS
eukprot:1143302-Pelagomonas_calceolata.AAC.4